MSKLDAIAYLETLYADIIIADRYERNPTFADACNAALDGFEYPDWDYRTVGALLHTVAKRNPFVFI